MNVKAFYQASIRIFAFTLISNFVVAQEPVLSSFTHISDITSYVTSHLDGEEKVTYLAQVRDDAAHYLGDSNSHPSALLVEAIETIRAGLSPQIGFEAAQRLGSRKIARVLFRAAEKTSK